MYGHYRLGNYVSETVLHFVLRNLSRMGDPSVRKWHFFSAEPKNFRTCPTSGRFENTFLLHFFQVKNHQNQFRHYFHSFKNSNYLVWPGLPLPIVWYSQWFPCRDFLDTILLCQVWVKRWSEGNISGWKPLHCSLALCMFCMNAIASPVEVSIQIEKHKIIDANLMGGLGRL